MLSTALCTLGRTENQHFSALLLSLSRDHSRQRALTARLRVCCPQRSARWAGRHRAGPYSQTRQREGLEGRTGSLHTPTGRRAGVWSQAGHPPPSAAPFSGQSSPPVQALSQQPRQGLARPGRRIDSLSPSSRHPLHQYLGCAPPWRLRRAFGTRSPHSAGSC